MWLCHRFPFAINLRFEFYTNRFFICYFPADLTQFSKKILIRSCDDSEVLKIVMLVRGLRKNCFSFKAYQNAARRLKSELISQPIKATMLKFWTCGELH